MEERQGRQTAYKIWLAELTTGEYVKTAGEWEPNYIDIKGKQVSRINTIGYVLEKFENPDKSYTSITLDDKSGSVGVRAWREDISLLTDINTGDLVLVVGKVKDFNGKIYITPEIVRKLDNPSWAKLRMLELERDQGIVERKETPIVKVTPQPVAEEAGPVIIEEKVTEEKIEEGPSKGKDFRKKVLECISNLDTNNGADKNLVLSQAGLENEEGEKVLEELLKEGEIFEISPGKLRTTI